MPARRRATAATNKVEIDSLSHAMEMAGQTAETIESSHAAKVARRNVAIAALIIALAGTLFGFGSSWSQAADKVDHLKITSDKHDDAINKVLLPGMYRVEGALGTRPANQSLRDYTRPAHTGQ